jgi:hypothetical protein
MAVNSLQIPLDQHRLRLLGIVLDPIRLPAAASAMAVGLASWAP